MFQSVSRWLSGLPVALRARAGPRVTVNQQIVLRETDSLATHPVLLRNISMGGACIRTDLDLEKGTNARLHINLTGDVKFEVTGNVISVRRQKLGFFTEYGLRFVEMSFDDARTLGDYIDCRVQEDSADAHRGMPF